MPYSFAAIQAEVNGNKLDAKIELANGIETDLTLEFDDTIGLSLENVGISAEIVSLTDPLLLARLPNDLLTTLPVAFPMLITIEPPSNRGFSFSGMGSIELHTHNLEYVANTPLRLFKAPLNGQFEDITATMGAGSYRVRGHMGGFSQFLILQDLRTYSDVITLKYAKTNQRLSGYINDIPSTLYTELDQHLSASQSAFQNNDLAGAIAEMSDFIKKVDHAQGSQLLNIWRSSRDINNVAGDLMSDASTLRFSLRLATH